MNALGTSDLGSFYLAICSSFLFLPHSLPAYLGNLSQPNSTQLDSTRRPNSYNREFQLNNDPSAALYLHLHLYSLR